MEKIIFVKLLQILQGLLYPKEFSGPDEFLLASRHDGQILWKLFWLALRRSVEDRQSKHFIWHGE